MHGTQRAKPIAGATVNKQRREAGETNRRSAAASRKAAGSKKK